MSYGVPAPWGLKPATYLNGSLWTGQTSTYLIQHAYAPGGGALGLYQYDPVTLLADGTVGIGVVGTNALIGAFISFEFVDANGVFQSTNFLPSAQATKGNTYIIANVTDDPNLLYDIQTNASPGLAITNLNNNAALVAGAGNSVSHLSGYMLDQSTANNGQPTQQLKIIRFTPAPGNVPTDLNASIGYNNVLCLINNHIYKGGTGTNGV